MPLINLHTHKRSGNPEIFELVNQYPAGFDATIPNYSIGIHPWRVKAGLLESELAIIEKRLSEKGCLAVGECGLDKRTETSMLLQVAAFERQLALAENYQKPVIIHCVAAFQEIIETKNRLKMTVPMIVHGFSKKRELAKQLLENGFYLSFGKYLLRNPELESVFNAVPAQRIFLETDSLDEDISDVYALAAHYRGVEQRELEQQITSNFNSIFKTEII